METHAHRHGGLAAVGQHHLLLQPAGRQPVGDLALEFVREMLVDRIVGRIRIVAALDQHFVVRLHGFRHRERLAFQNAVVVVVLFLDGNGVLIGAPLEQIAPVLDPVGRKENRQAEHLRPALESLRFIDRRRAQNLCAQTRIAQPHQVGSHLRHQQRRIVALAELHGPQTVEIDTPDHLTTALRSSPPGRSSIRRRPACRPPRRCG